MVLMHHHYSYINQHHQWVEEDLVQLLQGSVMILLHVTINAQHLNLVQPKK